MKRKKNFLLFMWVASLLGLFAVQAVHTSASAGGFYIPDGLAVFETEWSHADSIKGNSDLVALLSAETFNDTVKNYALTSAYKARILLLGFNWKPLSGTEAMDSTAAPVKVFFQNKEVLKYDSSNRNFGTYYTDVYVIPFEAGVKNVSGQVEVDLSSVGGEKLTYTAVVTRDEVDDITALRGIWVTDSVREASATQKSDSTIFNVAAGDGDDGKLVESEWTISFKNGGKAKADTLYFQKFDDKSTVHVIKNDKDTLDAKGETHGNGQGFAEKYTHIGNEIYKVKIEAGNRYTIAVTARDNKTRGFYYVTLLDDTVKTRATGDSLLLKDLYLYEKDNNTVRYYLRADTSGKLGFHADTLRYKVTAPWSESLTAGYELWDTTKFQAAEKEVLVLRYEKESGERFIEVRATRGKTGTEGKGSLDTTYTIRVFSGDNSLKNLHLSFDKADENPLELTSGLSDNVFEYTSVGVEWDTDSVFVWATTRDDKAKVDGFDTTKGVFFKKLKLLKEPGVKETFSIPVWAEDSTLIKTYKVIVRRKWNPNFDFVTFSWTGGQQDFAKDELAKSDVFDVKVPVKVDLEYIDVTHSEKDKNYYRVTETLKSVGDQYSYVIRVVSVDRDEKSKVDKIYTFNLLRPSNNAFLSFLSAIPGELSPAFDPDIFEYSVRVPHEQDFIYFVAEPHDAPEATVEGDNKKDLEVGERTFSIIVTAEDKQTKKEYKITVTRDPATGILSTGVSAIQVSVSGQSLHVNTPAAEQVSVYSAGGKLLYSLDKPAGKTSVSGLPKGILIVKGSSGWVEKAAIR